MFDIVRLITIVPFFNLAFSLTDQHFRFGNHDVKPSTGILQEVPATDLATCAILCKLPASCVHFSLHAAAGMCSLATVTMEGAFTFVEHTTELDVMTYVSIPNNVGK